MKKADMNKPSLEQLEEELRYVQYKNRYKRVLRSTIYTLITVAAAAILVATLWLPVLKIYGNSMTPTLQDGEIIFTVKTSHIENGDIVAFYYNNKILIKRVIAGPSQWVNLDHNGVVYVNNEQIEEKYITQNAYGDADIDFPYQIPDGKYFVMGDHRETSIDSRHSEVGCIAEEQIVGKIVFRLWPLDRMTVFSKGGN